MAWPFTFSNTPTTKLLIEKVLFLGTKGKKVEGVWGRKAVGVQPGAEEEKSPGILKWKMEGEKYLI